MNENSKIVLTLFRAKNLLNLFVNQGRAIRKRLKNKALMLQFISLLFVIFLYSFNVIHAIKNYFQQTRKFFFEILQVKK